jgi:excisionase family DNA binding protein
MWLEVYSTCYKREQGACMRLTDTAFYTTAELADFLKLKPRTIQRWVDSGQLKAYVFGRKYRIKGEDFERFLETYKTKRAKEAFQED